MWTTSSTIWNGRSTRFETFSSRAATRLAPESARSLQLPRTSYGHSCSVFHLFYGVADAVGQRLVASPWVLLLRRRCIALRPYTRNPSIHCHFVHKLVTHGGTMRRSIFGAILFVMASLVAFGQTTSPNDAGQDS